MKREFVLLLAVCTLTAAMVPRKRTTQDGLKNSVKFCGKNILISDPVIKRALNLEDEDGHGKGADLHTICAEQTPCKWIIYNSGHEPLIILNSYCECSKTKNCVFTENNSNSNSDVFRCRAPGEEPGESSDSENS